MPTACSVLPLVLMEMRFTNSLAMCLGSTFKKGGVHAVSLWFLLHSIIQIESGAAGMDGLKPRGILEQDTGAC